MIRLPWQRPLPTNAALNILQLWRLEAERMNQFRWNSEHNSTLGPLWQSRDQMLKFLKFKRAAGRHVGKYWKYHNPPSNWPIGTKLGWSYPITFPTCPSKWGCHGNGRCLATGLATALWTFSSDGRLEAERVNQFWWNLVYNSKLGQQWHSWWNIKSWRTVVVGKYSKCYNSPANGPTGTQLWWLHPIMFPILEML